MKFSLQDCSSRGLERATPEQPGMPTYCLSTAAALCLHYVEAGVGPEGQGMLKVLLDTTAPSYNPNPFC